MTSEVWGMSHVIFLFNLPVCGARLCWRLMELHKCTNYNITCMLLRNTDSLFLLTLKQMFPSSQQLPHLCPCPDNILRQLVSYRSCHLTIVFLFQACPVLSAEQLYQRRPQTPVFRLPPVLCACCASLYWCSCIFTAFARVPAWICIGS